MYIYTYNTLELLKAPLTAHMMSFYWAANLCIVCGYPLAFPHYAEKKII